MSEPGRAGPELGLDLIKILMQNPVFVCRSTIDSFRYTFFAMLIVSYKDTDRMASVSEYAFTVQLYDLLFTNFPNLPDLR